MPLSKKEQDKINLCSTYRLTEEDRRKGGINSAAARKERKAINELVDRINQLKDKVNEQNIKAQTGNEFDGEIDKQTVLLFKVYELAMKGDTTAMKMWLDLSDERNSKKKDLDLEKLRADIARQESETKRTLAEVEKLRAEIDALKKGKESGTEAPTFVFKFKDFSMGDENG